MHELLYFWTVEIERDNHLQTFHSGEYFGVLSHLWDDLLLTCFHPEDQNLYVRYMFGYRRGEDARVLIRRKGINECLMLKLDLNIQRYLNDNNKQLLEKLEVSRSELIRLAGYTRSYLEYHRIYV